MGQSHEPRSVRPRLIPMSRSAAHPADPGHPRSGAPSPSIRSPDGPCGQTDGDGRKDCREIRVGKNPRPGRPGAPRHGQLPGRSIRCSESAGADRDFDASVTSRRGHRSGHTRHENGPRRSRRGPFSLVDLRQVLSNPSLQVQRLLNIADARLGRLVTLHPTSSQHTERGDRGQSHGP